MDTEMDDYKHIAGELEKELVALHKKYMLIEDRIKKKTKGIKKDKIRIKTDSWRNHETGIKWDILFAYSIDGYKLSLNFVPVTTIDIKERCYITFAGKEEKKALKNNNIIIKVFREHFIERYKERTKYVGITNNEVVSNFFFQDQLGKIRNFIQNEKWFMYLNDSGIAMIQLYENYLIFDTFISPDQLKPEQATAVVNHLDELKKKPALFLMMTLYLMKTNKWGKFIKREDSQKATNEFVNDPNISQENKQLFMYEMQKYTDWITGQ